MKCSVLKVFFLASMITVVACHDGGGGGTPSDDAWTPVDDPYHQVFAGECSGATPPSYCTFEYVYNQGYNSGYNEGWDEGESWGYDDGYNAGYNSGYDSGYDSGYNSGYDDAYYYYASKETEAESPTDTNFSAGRSESNKLVVKRAATRLTKEYGIPQEKSYAIASALQTWRLAGVERGFTTQRDINTTFTKVFGVEVGDATAAVRSFAFGDKEGMRDLTNRSASALGIKPHQAKKFIKGMYRQALTDAGYDAESMDW